MAVIVKLDDLADFVDVYAVCEGHNPTGSIKDRFADQTIRRAGAFGFLKRGMTIIETSAGPSALALARIAHLHGHKSEFYLPTTINLGMLAQIKNYGSDVHLMDPSDPYAPIDIILEKVDSGGYYWPQQYFNVAAPTSYYGLADEIITEIGGVDVLSCAVGTGGTIMGLSQRLLQHNPEMIVIASVAKKSAHIQGIRPEGITLDYRHLRDLYHPLIAKKTVTISDVQAKWGQDILAHYGIDAGPSGGAAFASFDELLPLIPPESNLDAIAVIVLANGVKR